MAPLSFIDSVGAADDDSACVMNRESKGRPPLRGINDAEPSMFMFDAQQFKRKPCAPVKILNVIFFDLADAGPPSR
ncbi:MAG: hypothetical protein WCK55_18110 [Verrucomicrobiota bacterium]